jgi:putative membrane-bound dehydrogenase-like protein
LAAAVCALAATAVAAQSDETPRPLAEGWRIERIAAEPDLVTPTGCCIDDRGRLLVIECNTHFPPEDYRGHATDRIYLFDDSDGDGIIERQRLFYDGSVASMNLANLGDGWIAVVTRSELFRIRDLDGDDVADQRETLLRHETEATYPHNGLGGLTMGHDGWVYVGQGENFGETYRLIGADGAVQIGGGEGGNIFRCRPDGSSLQRVATGFWNPFGLQTDRSGRLWVAGNDPDSMPPNRLLHVPPGSDFGFQFRFGRAGIHPLQSWDGEFPGTLPMVAGTGEAACAVLVHDGSLLVTSWGDNRIERHTIHPRGASWTSTPEILIQGDENFRPVAMAMAGDGSIYVTDWVDRSYPVHGKGRLWRVVPPDAERSAAKQIAGLTEAERNAATLREDRSIPVEQRVAALTLSDPFIRQAAQYGLIATDQLAGIDAATLTDPNQRIGRLTALRWQEMCDSTPVSPSLRAEILSASLADPSEDVVLAAIRWATEQKSVQHQQAIRQVLERQNLSPRLFSATIAALAYLETGSAAGGNRDPAIERLLIQVAADPQQTTRLRAYALRRIPAESAIPKESDLLRWMQDEPDRQLGMEIVRLLAARQGAAATQTLRSIANDLRVDDQTRADAIALSALTGPESETSLAPTSTSQPSSVVAEEIKRIAAAPASQRNRDLPAPTDTDAWYALVGQGGDGDAGRRVFYRRGCIACHKHSDRGATTGPDLTNLAGTASRRRVLESILMPSKEIGPMYAAWLVQTIDGRVLAGMKLDREGAENRLRFQAADGSIFEIPPAEIETLRAADKSIMPEGLPATMALDELRDLLAFLCP